MVISIEEEKLLINLTPLLIRKEGGREGGRKGGKAGRQAGRQSSLSKLRGFSCFIQSTKKMVENRNKKILLLSLNIILEVLTGKLPK